MGLNGAYTGPTTPPWASHISQVYKANTNLTSHITHHTSHMSFTRRFPLHPPACHVLANPHTAFGTHHTLHITHYPQAPPPSPCLSCDVNSHITHTTNPTQLSHGEPHTCFNRRLPLHPPARHDLWTQQQQREARCSNEPWGFLGGSGWISFCAGEQ
jgi:hypothetical protein